jgi:hypothetical protein
MSTNHVFRKEDTEWDYQLVYRELVVLQEGGMNFIDWSDKMVPAQV